MAERREPAEGVAHLVLRAAGGADLPSWAPGAHVEVHVDPGADAGGTVRQYSLCGDPAERSTWEIAVLRQPAGHGGSRWVHSALTPGAVVRVGGPRNLFPLVDAERYLFVAGGIGITPMLPMIAEVARRGRDWSLVYGGRTLRSMAFREPLVAQHGERVALVPQDEFGVIDVEKVVAGAGAGTAVYCCGPEQLIAAVEARCGAGFGGTLHVERFTPRPQHTRADGAFKIELLHSAKTLEVPADRSILDVVLDAGLAVHYSCEEGTCGSCWTGLAGGVAEHRDSILDDEDRAAQDQIYICVSRAVSPTLRLEL